MLPHQQRVIEELAELDKKIERLHEFNVGAIFLTLSEDDKRLLRNQLRVMREYAAILRERIQNFKP